MKRKIQIRSSFKRDLKRIKKFILNLNKLSTTRDSIDLELRNRTTNLVRRRSKMQNEMNRLEILTVLYSLQALLDANKIEETKAVIDKIIKETEKKTV